MTEHTQDPTNPVDVEADTTQADVLCFIYANADYGFEPAEVADQINISVDTARDELNSLWRQDLIEKTADGYFFAFDDPIVARHAADLAGDDDFALDQGIEPYPDEIHDTTAEGYPDEP